MSRMSFLPLNLTDSVKALYRKPQWFGRLLFYRHGVSTSCLINSVKALNELVNLGYI